jgi:gluconolactonase
LKTPFTFSFSLLLVGSAVSLYACGGSDPTPTGSGGSGAGASGGSAGKTNASGGTGAGGMTATGGSGGSSGAATTGGAGGTTGGTGTGGGAGKGAGGSSASGGSAGAGTGGAAGTTSTGGSAGAGTGGSTMGGAGGTGGSTGGAAGSAGSAMGGAAGTGGSAGSGATGGWKCPAGVTTAPMLSGTPTRVASVPPKDDFNQNGNNFGNVEGPVWIGDALYVSEMSSTAYGSDDNVKKSRILKVTSDGTTSIFIADSGSNGLATDADGNIVAAVHKDGSITRFAMPSGTPTPIVTMYNGKRFDSPNDLAIHSNGTIYFSDPNFQAPNNLPQPKTLAYRVAPGSNMAEPIPSAASPDNNLSNPNGVTLSLAEDYLYISAGVGRRYPVMADGSLGAGQDFTAATGGDGMAIDCAGNLYVAQSNAAKVVVYKPDGTMIGSITVPEVQSATNVAFGGADHQTLYITGLGNSKGLFKMTMNLPGRPY